MISIIVSSYKPTYFANFTKSVQETIGDIAYEILPINNPGLMGVCEAYNKGGAQAQYPYLIFCHEDIVFHTHNWGQILINAFNSDLQIGLIGVLGGKYKSYVYSGWLSGFGTSSQMIHNADGKMFYSKRINDQDTFINLHNQPIEEAYSNVPQSICNEDVATIDGLFMATTGKVFDLLKFDQQTFTHFHCYDVDYSLQVIQTHEVVVNYNILIEHRSSGNFDKTWFNNTLLLHKKWHHSLPVTPLQLTPKQVSIAEYKAFENLAPYLRRNKEDLPTALKPLYSLKLRSLMGLFNWLYFQQKVMVKALKAWIK